MFGELHTSLRGPNIRKVKWMKGSQVTEADNKEINGLIKKTFLSEKLATYCTVSLDEKWFLMCANNETEVLISIIIFYVCSYYLLPTLAFLFCCSLFVKLTKCAINTCLKKCSFQTFILFKYNQISLIQALYNAALNYLLFIPAVHVWSFL